MRVPCFDQANTCPGNEFAGHYGMALGNFGEGEGSQGRLGFHLVIVVLIHVFAPCDLATLFRRMGRGGMEMRQADTPEKIAHAWFMSGHLLP